MGICSSSVSVSGSSESSPVEMDVEPLVVTRSLSADSSASSASFSSSTDRASSSSCSVGSSPSSGMMFLDHHHAIGNVDVDCEFQSMYGLKDLDQDATFRLEDSDDIVAQYLVDDQFEVSGQL